MKKIALLSFLMFFSSFYHLSFAQSLILLDADGLDITNSEIYIEDESSALLMKAEVFFKNNTDEDLDVFVRKIEIDITPGTINYFCWDGSCLSETVFESENPITIAPGETSTAMDFYADYLPEGQEGTSIIEYEFYSDKDSFETAKVTVNFITKPTHVNEEVFDYSQHSISSVFPNPAADHTIVKYKLPLVTNNSNLKLYSITGNKLEEFAIQPLSSSITINTSTLSRGVYIMVLSVNDRIISTRKLMINR